MTDLDQGNTTLTPDAMYFKREDGKLQCAICAHGCALREGQRGVCHVRERRGDAIVSLVHGRVVAEHIDPIEKKPLFHVLPGSFSYSISTLGCNFRCLHCQNASISQVPRDMDVSHSGVYRHPKTIVATALENNCRSISYTYVEPAIFFEYAYDCSVAAVEKGLKNIFVSNGYMSDAASRILAPVLTAINIDLKSLNDSFYKKVCGARLAPVLDSIIRFKELGVWVEVTTLIIPGMNDSEQELNEIASFLVGIDRDIPWHVTGFYPTYKMMDVPPTGGEILVRAREIGLAQGLEYVYTGNRPEVVGENTTCPSCKETVIKRHGFQIEANHLQDGCCPHCGSVIPGVWK